MTLTIPTFSKNDKFDGTNWLSWYRLVHTAAVSRGVFGYLDGSITQPSTPPQTETPPAETPWDSEIPSFKKWKACNTWTLDLLLFNTKNPAGLGINIDGTAADAWTSYINTYEKAYNMARLNMEQILQNTTYSDHIDFTDFIINMQTKWSDARVLGSKITDEDFKDIIISSLPESWSSATAPLYDSNMTSTNAIAHLQIWYTKSHRNRLTNSNQNIMALQTSTTRQGSRSQLVCANPNCHHCGHTIEMYYWPGGGKEGQFPPSFGKRGRFRGSAANT